jgi:hypothetical protein
MFACGSLKTITASIKMSQGAEPYEIPVPWFLIVHPKGNRWRDQYDLHPRPRRRPSILSRHPAHSGLMLLAVDAAYATHHWEEKAVADTVDTVLSVRKLPSPTRPAPRS